MTRAEFRKHMSVWGNDFYMNTCPKLQAEIVRKIMNNKAMNDSQKMIMLEQYIGNLSTNDCIVDSIKQYNEGQ